MALVLASGSPRRKELMKYLAETFTVRVPDVDESAPPALQPWMLVQQLAKRKGDAVFETGDGTDTVIAADTVVCANGRVLGKPRNAEGAFAVADKYAQTIAGRDVILIDDVATTGATLASAADALRAAGAAGVRFAVLFLAAEKPQSESGGIWFEDDDAPEPDGDPLADDVGF